MSTVQEPPALASETGQPASELIPFQFTAVAFDQMIEAGIFPRDDRVELWDGRIYAKMAQTQAHAAAGINVTMTLPRFLPPGWCLSPENPVALGPKETPLPDFAVLRGRGNDYRSRRPVPANVGVLVELSMSSLRPDTGVRLTGYARANIPVYWVLNLIENVILVFERPVPTEGRYESMRTYAVGQAVPLRLGGILVAEIPALDLLSAQS